MKTRFAYFPWILLLLLAGCSKPNEVTPDKDEKKVLEPVTIRLTSSLPDDGTGRKAVLVQRSSVEGDVRVVTSSAPEKGEGGTAVFTFTGVPTSQDATAWYYGVLYPSEAAGSATGTSVFLTMAPEQSPRADGPDLKAVVYAASSKEKYTERPKNLSLSFKPLSAYGKLSLTGLTLKEGESLRSVSLSAPGKDLTGSFSYDMLSGEAKYASSVSVPTLRVLGSALEIKDGGRLDIHFATKPFSLAATDELTLSFVTDLRSFESVFTAGAPVQFQAGETASLSVAVTVPGSDDGGGEGGDEWTPDPGYTVTGRTWYISPQGDDRAGGTSTLDAVKTFDKVLTLISPGDQVRIMPGTYESSTWKDILTLEKKHSGTEGHYISFVAHDPDNRPVFHATGKGVWNAVNCDASYIAFDGIEIRGDNASINLQDAYNAALSYYNTGTADWGAVAVYNANGLSIGGTSSTSKPNHVIVRNCLVHDMPGAGLSAIRADYITFEYNRIYNCAWFMMYGGSGISFLTPEDTDSNTGYKMIVRGNIVSNCHTDVPWVRVGTAFDYSDGNGIIIDINDGYNGRTLVENNVSFNNGGSGIHGYRARHVDIVGNTAYWNGWKYNGNYGEIWAHQGGDVRIYNNIMYGRPVSENGRCNLGNNAVYTNNVYFQGQVKIAGTGDLVADPKFVNLSIDNVTADFHLTENSPAIGHGSMDMPYLPERDIEGKLRTTRFDCGAYQY